MGDGVNPEHSFQLNAHYTQILDSLSDMVLVKGPKSRLLWANRAFLTYYGMTNEELQGIIDAPFSDPDYTQQFVRDDAKVFETGKVLNIPAEPVTRFDGQVRYFHTVKTPILDEQGQVIMTVGVSRDIHDKLAQEALIDEQRQRMITSSKFSALGEMSGAIAHEINNPLTVIHGRAGQLKELAEAGVVEPVQVLEVATKIEKTTLRISKIVKALKSFARDGEKDPFDIVLVADLVEDTVEFCRERFRSYRIDLTIEVDPNLTLECQPVPLSQVLLNLLLNSLDAVYPLSEKWVKVQITEEGEFIRFRITDSGRGIPADLHEKIMRPFFTTKEVGHGTGIGLSVSKGIVESHRGSLALDAQNPHTSFVVDLPARQPIDSPS